MCVWIACVCSKFFNGIGKGLFGRILSEPRFSKTTLERVSNMTKTNHHFFFLGIVVLIFMELLLLHKANELSTCPTIKATRDYLDNKLQVLDFLTMRLALLVV
jgi:hypothetical protein